VVGLQLTRVLIDAGGGLNLLFASTLKKMGLNISKMLTPSKAPFYGIISGNAATPLGSVVLPVTFGIEENYRTEYIKFEVADFQSSYHALMKSLTLRLAASCSLSLTATRVTIRLLSRKKSRSRQHSSPPLEHMPTQLYPSG
jgi:hypothetical protein